MGFLPSLCLLLVGLKLGGLTTISWATATAPIWVPAAMLGAVAAALGLILLMADRLGRR